MVDTLLKNTGFLTFSRLTNKILGAFLVIVISRKLGVEGLGNYGFIFAFTALIFLLSEIGDPVVLRELAVDRKKTGEYLWNAFSLKVLKLVSAYLILAFVIRFYPIGGELKKLVFICGLVSGLGYLSHFPSIAFNAHQKFKFSAIGGVIKDSIATGLSLVALLCGKGLVWVLYAFLIGCFAEAAYNYSTLFKHFLTFKIYKLKLFLWARWLKQGFYFSLQTIFGKSFFNLSILILSFLTGAYYVGIYNAAFKIISGIQFAYTGFISVVYPYYSSFTQRDEIKKAYKKCRLFSFTLSVPIFLFLMLSSKLIINIVYGAQFGESVVILKIMSVGLLFGFLGRNAGTFLNAIKKEKINSYFLAIIFSFSVLLEILLIYVFGVRGAAVSFVLLSLLYFLVSVLYIKKIGF